MLITDISIGELLTYCSISFLCGAAFLAMVIHIIVHKREIKKYTSKK